MTTGNVSLLKALSSEKTTIRQEISKGGETAHTFLYKNLINIMCYFILTEVIIAMFQAHVK